MIAARVRKRALIEATVYELERRLGHRSQRYIQRYTIRPEKVSLAKVVGV
jgi:hypothetical protein